MSKQDLLDFFRYLERRGFLREDLQCDPEHQIETYLNDFCDSKTISDTLEVKDLLDFFRYLDRRGFLWDELQCNPEHQVMVYLRDFYKDNKPAEPQYVDLGLPSGTLWADRNIGANSPEEYGVYYTLDEAKTLDCTLPSNEQFDELANKCSSIWTTQNGINGRLLTGPNGNKLFLPAAGYYEDTAHYDECIDGNYWTSTLTDGIKDYTYYLYFNSDSVECRSDYYYYEYYYCSLSVRAVKNKEE